MVQILQLVHEISSFSQVLYKKGDLNNFSKSTDKHKKQSSKDVLPKFALKSLAKIHRKTSLPESLFNKVAGWKPGTVRSRHWKCKKRGP